MDTMDESLRLLVEKWFGANPMVPARVVRSGRMPSSERRYAYVQSGAMGEPVGIYFFLHDDGSWCVFPPGEDRPEMRALLAA